MNTKMLIIGVLATITVIIVGVISAFMVINNEAPATKQLEISNTEDNNKTEKKKNLMDGKKKNEIGISIKIMKNKRIGFKIKIHGTFLEVMEKCELVGYRIKMSGII